MRPLRFPEHFPPTTRWKKFFIGVRWLGPDLSFFKAMKSEQAQRTPEQMASWGEGRERVIAEAISKALAEQLGWKSQVFLPEDSVAASFRGPSFDLSDPEFATEAVLELLNKDFKMHLTPTFLEGHWRGTLGEMIEALAAHHDA